MLIATISLFLLASCDGAVSVESTAVPTTNEETAATAVSTEPPETTDTSADSQWSDDPTQNIAVTHLGGDQATPAIVTMDNGDFFIAWFSNATSENYDVRMQKYDPDGNALWEENGRVISDNSSDT